MANDNTKQRYISSSYWDDNFVWSMSTEGKLLYLYLLSNKDTNIAGIYQISYKSMVVDTGIELSEVKKILKELRDAEKAFYIDEYMIIPSWPRHQKWKQRVKIKLGIDSVIQCLPEEIIEKLISGEIPYHYDVESALETTISNLVRKKIPSKLREEILERDNWTCNRCGATQEEAQLEIDHIIPVSEGGSNDPDNLRILCKRCNGARNGKRKGGNQPSDNDNKVSENEERAEKGVHPPKKGGNHLFSVNDSDLDSDSDLDLLNITTCPEEPDPDPPLEPIPKKFQNIADTLQVHFSQKLTVRDGPLLDELLKKHYPGRIQTEISQLRQNKSPPDGPVIPYIHSYLRNQNSRKPKSRAPVTEFEDVAI